MGTSLKIRDLTLRDGQQSQFATRMNQTQVDRVLPLFRKANFYAMEVWGGAVPDSVMRYLNEDPWKRLESIKEGIAGASLLTALSRGRNLFGYTPYPDSVIRGFCANAVKSGIDIMRIFDALNDVENMKSSIQFVKEAGGMADCAVCYSVDPVFPRSERIAAFFKGKKLPHNLFTTKYYVKKAKELAKLGADMITLKDMAGLVDPRTGADLIRALKSEVGVPINLHTHCTPGFGVASMVSAMMNKVDIIDTAILSFSGGPAAPAYEIIRIFADKMGIDTGVDASVVAAIDTELRFIRSELSAWDQFKLLPPAFNTALDKLEPATEEQFDRAIAAGRAKKWEELTVHCHRIEASFNYPAPDDIVRHAQIPGGMYTNMLAQLQEAKLGHLVGDVLKAVPEVRLDCGVPPLVTPTSQIVGAQAVNCVISRAKGEPLYANISKNFSELVKGSYGTTPWPVDPAFREKICGVRDAVAYDTSKYRRQPNPAIPEAGGMLLARDEKEELLLELFPSVADKFLRAQKKAEWQAAHSAHSSDAADAQDANRGDANHADSHPWAPSVPAAPALAPEPEIPEAFPEEFWNRVTASAGI